MCQGLVRHAHHRFPWLGVHQGLSGGTSNGWVREVEERTGFPVHPCFSRGGKETRNAPSPEKQGPRHSCISLKPFLPSIASTTCTDYIRYFTPKQLTMSQGKQGAGDRKRSHTSIELAVSARGRAPDRLLSAETNVSAESQLQPPRSSCK